MALTALNWRRMASQAVGSSTVENILNAIYTAYGAATYIDGETRAGKPTAWTILRYQNVGVTEAVYGTPPAAAVNDLRVIISGVDAGAPTPTMQTPDIFGTGKVLCSINKSSGVFNAWDAAAPFTSGNFFGYWNCTHTINNIIAVHCFESQEAIAVFFEGNTGLVSGCILGAHFDPLTSNALDAETSGRLYGILTSGTSSYSSSLWDAGGILQHSPFNSGYHAGVFNPGLGTIDTLASGTLHAAVTGNSKTTVSGSPVLWPVCVQRYNSPYQLRAKIREILMFGQANMGDVVQDSGAVDRAYLASGHTVNAGYEAAAFLR